MFRVIISKKGETWFAVYQEKVYQGKRNNNPSDVFEWYSRDSVEGVSFSELQIEIGNKGWIDQINKNE